MADNLETQTKEPADNAGDPEKGTDWQKRHADATTHIEKIQNENKALRDKLGEVNKWWADFEPHFPQFRQFVIQQREKQARGEQEPETTDTGYFGNEPASGEQLSPKEFRRLEAKIKAQEEETFKLKQAAQGFGNLIAIKDQLDALRIKHASNPRFSAVELVNKAREMGSADLNYVYDKTYGEEERVAANQKKIDDAVATALKNEDEKKKAQALTDTTSLAASKSSRYKLPGWAQREVKNDKPLTEADQVRSIQMERQLAKKKASSDAKKKLLEKYGFENF